MIGAAMITLAAPDFTLSWIHSVEKIAWVEDWTIEDTSLRLTRVAIKGSGAGMEPDDSARLENGWWVWNPDMSVPLLRLAASGKTGAGWTLCSGPECRELGATASAPLIVQPCGG